MPDSSSLTLKDRTPLYIRWSPDRSPHAVEMRLDLITQLSGDLERSATMGIEIGGMLLGTLPGNGSSTLRIDDLVTVGRRFEDGPIYMLDPEQNQHLAELRESAQEEGRVPVGFFRSHLRPGPLEPSLTDKTLMAEHFGESLFAFLLIQCREPRTACFFLSSDGHLPDEPSVRKFFFDASAFKSLPEVAVEDTGLGNPEPAAVPAGKDWRYRWLAAASIAALAILLILGAFAGGLARMFRPASNKLDLAVAANGGNILEISWDHSAPFVSQARGAVLTIADGQSRREIRLGPDELRLGEVDYQYQAGKVDISMVLDSPDAALPPQTLEWTGAGP